MQAIAKLRGIKGSPQKARLVIDLIRGRNVSQALAILKFTNKRAAHPIAKCLNSAIANATYMAEQQNIAIDPEDLWVKTCFVDMGPHKNRRRMRPAPQGRAYREQRHYCHITIEVSSEDSPDKKKLKYSPNVKNVDTPISKDDVKVKGKAEKEVLKETGATENTEKETKTDSAEKAIKTEGAILGEEVKVSDKAPEVKEKTTENAPENTDVTDAAPDEVAGKETATGETDTPFENKPLAAQTDEEKTGTDMAADAKIDKVEELEKQ
jgi:large subunit ribosomal protein L22